MLLALALSVTLATPTGSTALTGGVRQPRGYDFGDPSPPDLTDSQHIRVYTTGGEVLLWPRGPIDEPLKFLFSNQPARHERLQVVHHDGTPFEPERDGEDIWDPTVERSLDNPDELVLYAGAMKPNPGQNTAVWPNDNWRRRTFAFTRKTGMSGPWIMKEDPLFDDPTDDIESGTWVGHNYGHSFLKDESGSTFIFYERVIEERSGHPWKTELFARKMLNSFKASPQELSILKVPKRAWPSAQRSFGGTLLEGARPFKIGGYYFISFSAGDYTSDEYGIHLAWSKKLTGPYTPYLNSKRNDLFNFGARLESLDGNLTWGAARASFFEAQGAWWVLYHGIDENRPRLGAYIEDGLRDIYLAPVTIRPLPKTQPQSAAAPPPFEILLGY